MNTVRIPRPLVNQLLHHAQHAAGNEICGLIAVRGGDLRCIPVANVAATPATRFAMDPKGQIDAMRGMRERGESLFAIYHSHPGAPAVPSATDTAEAAYPEALYLIITLATKGIVEMRGYRWDSGFTEIPLELE